MISRKAIQQFTDIPNVGKATDADLKLLGFNQPDELANADPYQMYFQLCDLTAKQQDPCVIDVFISAVRFMQGEPAQNWWYYTAERKQHLNRMVEKNR